MEEQKRLPKLRFEEFVDGWKNEKVGALGIFKGGGTPSTNNSEYWKGKTPWISSSDLNENDIHHLNISRYLSDDAIKESATKIIPEGSILFVARVGIGKVAVANQDLCTSQDFANLIPRKDDGHFIAYYFISKSKLLFQYSQGTSIKGFTTGDLKNIPINIPALPEQQKIASFLSAVDKKIAQLQQKKALLEAYKKGVMQQIFTQELRFTKEDGSAYPDWEEKRLSEYKELRHGDGDWILSKDISDEGEYKIVQLGNIGFGKYMDKDLKTISLDKFDELKGTQIYSGDLLINRMVDGNLNCCIFNKTGKYITSVDVCWIRQNNYFNNYFMMSLILYKQNQNKLLSLSSGSGRVRISKKNLFNEFKFKTPCLEEQTQIAHFLSAIDKKIMVVQTQIKKTQTFKKGLLQQMFV